jgi:hypothetical protein
MRSALAPFGSPALADGMPGAAARAKQVFSRHDNG